MKPFLSLFTKKLKYYFILFIFVFSYRWVLTLYKVFPTFPLHNGNRIFPLAAKSRQLEERLVSALYRAIEIDKRFGQTHG
jgi:hypothetical protein